MKRLLGILMVVSLCSGCGGDSPTGDKNRDLLTSTTTYDDGTVKEEYQYYHHPENNRRMKDGWYNSYYYSGEYKEIGNYTDDKKDGKWSEYDETGNIIDEETYREGLCVESCDWKKTFGDGSGYSVQQTVDGGFIVTGYDDGDGLLLKTDGQGNEQWRKIFGDGWGYSVQQTVDGGFVVTGSHPEGLLLLKTNELGNI